MAKLAEDDDRGKIKKDALIYQKRNDTDSKAEYEKLDASGKFQYFKDYYLKNILIVLVLILIGGYYIVGAVTKPNNTVYIAIADDTFDKEQIKQLEKDIETYLGLDGKKEVVSINVDYSSKSGQSDQQLENYLYSGDCDIVIASQEGFEYWAEGGYFLEPESSELVSFYEDVPESDRIYTTVTEGAEIRGEKEVDNTKYNFGVSVFDSEKYKALEGKGKTAVAGVVNSSNHIEEAAAVLEYILDNEIKPGTVNSEFAGEQ